MPQFQGRLQRPRDLAGEEPGLASCRARSHAIGQTQHDTLHIHAPPLLGPGCGWAEIAALALESRALPARLPGPHVWAVWARRASQYVGW